MVKLPPGTQTILDLVAPAHEALEVSGVVGSCCCEHPASSKAHRTAKRILVFNLVEDVAKQLLDDLYGLLLGELFILPKKPPGIKTGGQ